MVLQHFFDSRTSTLTYILFDEKTKDAICMDPVLDFDPASGRIWTESVNLVDSYISHHKLNLRAVLETHAHADHITGAQVLKRKYPHLQVCVGEDIKKVQATFSHILNLEHILDDGSQFDLLLQDGKEYVFGSIGVSVISTPGHTPACSSYLIDSYIFVGDCIFMPDSGTGRCDFPGGNAEDLYHSIAKKIYSLPNTVNICVGHDYQPDGRELQFKATVSEQKENNIQLKSNTAQNEFIKFRTERDKKLSAPKLLWPSIQVNINAGHIPKPDAEGKMYLKWPVFLENI